MRADRLVALLLALLLVGAGAPAVACSCVGFSAEGFIHPDVTVLPSNARGVIFQARAGIEPTPAMFSATSPDADAPLRVRIDPVVLPPEHPMGARLPPGQRLVRVGIEGGFKPGARYTIRIEEQPRFSVRNASVGFVVDPLPFDLAEASFSVRLDGPARRTMLALSDGGGACGTTVAALVQEFHVQVPAALQPYLPALSLFGEEQDALPGAAFVPVDYRPSWCTPRQVDRGALPDRHELVHRACRSAVDRIHIRGWVGMLEVDERVVPADPVTADLSALKTLSCSPYGMLREAIERGDDADVSRQACELGRWGDIQLGSLELDREPVPAPGQWTALVRQADAPVAACGMAAMSRMLMMSKPGHPEFRVAYLALAKERLRSYDPAVVAATLMQLVQLKRTLTRAGDARAAPAWPREVFLPLLPELLMLAEAGGEGARDALDLIGSLGAGARGAVARLYKLAERDTPEATGAIRALAQIIPADQAFQQSLLTWARRPALGNTPALAFARVAGKMRPQETVALLLPLAQADDVFAIDALADLGAYAAPAASVLLSVMERGSGGYTEGRALRALIMTAPDEAPVVDALVRKLLEPPNANLRSDDYLGLARFSMHAADLIPAVRHMIETLRWDFQKKDVRKLILAMNLDEARKNELLGQLDHAQSNQAGPR